MKTSEMRRLFKDRTAKHYRTVAAEISSKATTAALNSVAVTNAYIDSLSDSQVNEIYEALKFYGCADFWIKTSEATRKDSPV